MNVVEEYTNNLYEYLSNKFGSRLMAYTIEKNGVGYIKGIIDKKEFVLSCWQYTISVETSFYENGDGLTMEMRNYLTEYLGVDAIRWCEARGSIEDNREDLEYCLRYRIDEKDNMKIKK